MKNNKQATWYGKHKQLTCWVNEDEYNRLLECIKLETERTGYPVKESAIIKRALNEFINREHR